MNLSNEKKFCLTETTHLQSKHRTLTKKLLSLNPKAQTLRIARRNAEIAYKAAPPHLKPAAWSALQYIKSAQKTLKSYQKILLARGATQAHIFYLNMIKKYYIPQKKSLKLHVEPFPKNSDSPSYRLKKDYLERTSTYFNKTSSVSKIIPHILLKKMPSETKIQKYITICGASISEQRGHPSDIKLILDKY